MLGAFVAAGELRLTTVVNQAVVASPTWPRNLRRVLRSTLHSAGGVMTVWPACQIPRRRPSRIAAIPGVQTCCGRQKLCLGGMELKRAAAVTTPSALFRYPMDGPVTPAATAVRLRTNGPGHSPLPVPVRAKSRKPSSRSPSGMGPLFGALVDWAEEHWQSQRALLSWQPALWKSETTFVLCLYSYFCSFWTCSCFFEPPLRLSLCSAGNKRGGTAITRGSRTPDKLCSVNQMLSQKHGRTNINRHKSHPGRRKCANGLLPSRVMHPETHKQSKDVLWLQDRATRKIAGK